jgi:phage terminase small subunit
MKPTKHDQKQAETPVFPAPPEHLSERSRDLWRQLGPTEARSLQRRTFFQVGLEALDRADEARRLVAVEGMTTTTESTGAMHVNPLVKIERDSRAQFVHIWDLLGLKSNYQIDIVGRWPNSEER